jgi:hypothetical protein
MAGCHKQIFHTEIQPFLNRNPQEPDPLPGERNKEMLLEDEIIMKAV